ncbi:YeeE/YedE family protein [Nereida sp. MMG025]|uniref:YeeE/YedE family protein n=1 Tax=Nereida sp. MMG025 TaxID=2909981 RepID=UPI001F3E47AC|nr:YeeE/YedE family protein [Nereida sp. MMG025]MCF6445582.1 YeeE/YedE family protein [Nereida sp. MMG025]
MLYDLELLSIPPVLASVLFGLALGAVFGGLAQISRFCFRRGLVGSGSDRSQALGLWLVALATAVIGTQSLVFLGYLDFSAHRLATADVPWLAIAIGGLLFGAGMVLTRGCVSRLTVLAGSGNLRAVTVLVLFAVVAHATLKGVLAPVRVAIGSVTVPVEAGAVLPVMATFVVLAAIAVIVWRNRPSVRGAAFGVAIGALAPLGWMGTGVLLFDEFDPIALQSLSFTSPWADTLFWSIASSAVPAGFGTGLIGGVLLGAFLSAVIRGEAKLQSFESPEQTLRYGLGASLMGVGGVLAGGCTVGAGLSGIPTLSIAAIGAILAIAAGGLITDRLVDRSGLHAAPTLA